MKRWRLAVLLALLGLSLTALAFREELQVWLRGVGAGVQRLVGKPVPELPRRLRTLADKPLRLRDLRGRVVLLHFWTYG